MSARGRSFYHRHYWFLVVFTLFVSFRLLAILLFRPGGFFVDSSDYDFYYAWGQTVPMGYATFENLWTAYPPLFPAFMLPVFTLSAQIPPWVEPRLFFHLLLGMELLIFEGGNLILIYRLAGKLGAEESGSSSLDGAVPGSQIGLQTPALRAVLLYALMFAPVYTFLGWFETMPLFFMLLGLDLLLSRARGAWVVSAVAAALGFLVKLTPILLVPIAVRWFGARLSWHAARVEWFRRGVPGNLVRPAIYIAIFVGVVIGVGYPLARFNPELALSSFRINSLRPPWQSIWALMEGYYGFGLVPIDMRNLQGLAVGDQWNGRLPWGVITVLFLIVYVWLYTRRYDWTRMRTPIAFAGISVIWLFLYSKGWSPQFIVWIIAFLVLLLPTLRGVFIALTLTGLNLMESQVFLLLLPDEHWIMVLTVLLRTVLLLLLMVEFAGQIWPGVGTGRRLQAVATRASIITMVFVLLVIVGGAPRAAQAYAARQLAEHRCREAVLILQAHAGEPASTIATTEIGLWRDLYPWLHNDYVIRVLDSYDPNDRPAVAVVGEQLDRLSTESEFWWIEGSTGDTVQWSAAAAAFFERPDVYLFDVQKGGACQLARVRLLPEGQVLAVADAAGSAIELRAADLGTARAGQPLYLVLYWQAEGAVTASYTVFTQLFAPDGSMIAQQDNLPVNGLAPTNTWTPGTAIRDSYVLNIPAEAQPGTYTLHLGLYDEQGRRVLTLPDGAQADHLSYELSLE